ncbi:MAG: cynR 4 [Firmicutes bacterium]|nr:cynR 4 [Bacillota bacterium]
MEFRQLEYFQAVAKLSNFTKAAEQMYVSQPSITNGIHHLEQEIGVQLFDRNQKKVRLTAEGQVFLQRAEKILLAVNDMVTEMQDFRNLNKGTIRLALPPMIGAYLFPNIFPYFQKAFPSLELIVFEEGSLAARRMVEKEEVDLGLMVLPASSDSLINTLPFFKEKIVLCTSKTHRLSREKLISFRQLQNEKIILLKEDSYHRRLIINECQKNNFSPQIVFSSNQVQTIKSLVANNVGVSFLMNMVIRSEKNLISIPLEPNIEISIGLIWKKNKYLSKASQAFIDFITDYINSPEFKKVRFS